MAAKVKTLDICLTNDNTVYTEVPFTIVVDWLQQGRLLEEDQVRPSGTEKWYRISSSRTLAAYVPKREPNRVEDQAEALEPVAVDFSWKRPHGDEDDDPDMIPLIDISLVLLVFFMMTTTVIVAATDFDLPSVSYGQLFNATGGTVRVGIHRRVLADGREGPPKYSFGDGEKPAEAENRDLTEAEVVEKLGDVLRQNKQHVDVCIAADRHLAAQIVINMTAALESLRPYVREIHAEVSEKRR